MFDFDDDGEKIIFYLLIVVAVFATLLVIVFAFNIFMAIHCTFFSECKFIK